MKIRGIVNAALFAAILGVGWFSIQRHAEDGGNPADAAQEREALKRAVFLLADAGTIMMSCAGLPGKEAEDALRFDDMALRIMSLIERVGEQYGADNLVLAADIVMTRARSGEYPYLNEMMQETYGGCNDKLLADMVAYVEANEIAFAPYLGDSGKAQHGSAPAD